MRLPLIAGDLNDVYSLPDAKHVWVAGDDGLLLASQDGGDTWKRFELKFERSRISPRPTMKSESPPDPVQLPNEPAKKFIYRPERLEEPQAKAAPNSPVQQPRATASEPDSNELIDLPYDLDMVHFVTPELGCALAGFGRYVVTRDGGATWSFEHGGYVGLARSLGVASADESLVDPTNSFWRDASVSSLRPVLFRAIVFDYTQGSGDEEGLDQTACLPIQPSGEFVRVPLTAFSHSARGLDGGWDKIRALAEAVVEGSPYAVWATQTGGLAVGSGPIDDWFDANSKHFGLVSIHIRNGRGIAVGDQGSAYTIRPRDVTREILTSSPDSVFTQVQAPTSADLNAVHLADASTAWVVGRNGTLLRTRDGGATWEICSRVLHTWDALEFSDREHGFGVADGRLLRTRDGGANWSAVERTANEWLKSLAAGPGAQWAVGGNQAILRSRDGWESVERIAAPAGVEDAENEEFWAIDFAQAYGVILGSERALITRDGGGTWSGTADGDVEAIQELANEAWGKQATTTLDGLPSVESHLKLGLLFDQVARWNEPIIDFWHEPTLTMRAPFRVRFDGRSYWFAEAYGKVERRSGQDLSLEFQTQVTSSELRALAPIQDRVFVAGTDDTLLRSDDGGKTWFDPRVYSRSPAPWYWASWIGVLALMIPVVRKPRPRLAKSGWVADAVVSDRPIKKLEDRLGFVPLAAGISRFLRNAATLPPLTIAITGKWGSGKSSLMNLVRDDLESFGYRSVAFNAWHNQQEEDLLAALLEAIKSQTTPEWWRPSGVGFRARLLWIRAKRRGLLIAATVLVFIGSVGFFAGNERRREQVGKDIGDFIDRPLVVVVDLIQSLAQVSTGTAPSESEKPAPPAERNALAEPGETRVDAPGNANAVPSIGAPDTKSVSKEKTQVSLLFAAVSFFGLLFGTLRHLHAFGTGATSVFGWIAAPFRKARAPASAQRRFAVEFDQVAQALEPRCPLILIDDLDRCQPDKVLRMLEATNYVVSAGNCFVLLAIERERVERSIAAGYDAAIESSSDGDAPVKKGGEKVGEKHDEKRVELRVGGRYEARDERGNETRDAAGTTTEQAAESTSAPKDASVSMSATSKDSRRTFAQLYLEKLVNIEVPVPKPHVDILSKIVRPMTKEELLAERSKQVAERLKSAGVRTVIALAAAGLLVGVYFLGEYLGRQPALPSATVPSVVGTGGDSSSPREDRPQASHEEPTNDGAKPRAVLVPPAPRADSWILGLLVAIASASLLGAGAWRLSKRSDPVEYDSQNFAEALAIWQPVAIANNPTPRAAKRFVNRVRYLATLQGDRQPDERPKWWWIPEKLRSKFEACLTRVREWVTDRLSPLRRQPDAGEPQHEAAPSNTRADGASPIPEADLVAIGAMDQFTSGSAVHIGREDDGAADRQKALSRAEALHVERFGHLPDSDARQHFAAVAQSVRVDG